MSKRWSTTRWLRNAHFADGLHIPARPHRVASLTLGANQATVQAKSATVDLAWAHHRSGPFDDLPQDRWTFVPWDHEGPDARRQGGAALAVDGHYVEATAELRSRTGGPRLGSDRLRAARPKVPLYQRRLASSWVCAADLAVLDALCALVAQRPELRPRLAERARVERLLADITGHPHGDHVPALRLRTVAVDSVQALRDLGYTHPHGGRPFPGATPVPTDRVVADVLMRLRGTRPDDRSRFEPKYAADVADLVDRAYARVEPWPFAALTD